MSTWFNQRDGRLSLTIHVMPNADRTAFAGIVENALRIRLHAPPREGKANEALVEFLARQLKVRKKQCTLIAGAKGRNKVVQIDGLGPGQAERYIALLIAAQATLEQAAETSAQGQADTYGALSGTAAKPKR